MISEKRQIGLIKRKISKKNLEVLVPSCKNLLNPKDYQNVPFAVELMKTTVDFKCEKSGMVTQHLCAELDCLSQIIKTLLNVFTNPTINF